VYSLAASRHPPDKRCQHLGKAYKILCLYRRLLTVFRAFYGVAASHGAAHTRGALCGVGAGGISRAIRGGDLTCQGSLGLAWHFNVSSRFYATMHTLTGIGAVTLTSLSVVLGVVIAATPYRPR
jgi:hypothetical protein